jgi:hypothetical protein
MNASVIFTSVAVAATIAIGPAASADATSDQQVQFMADVNQHGGLTTSQVFTVKDVLS